MTAGYETVQWMTHNYSVLIAEKSAVTLLHRRTRNRLRRSLQSLRYLLARATTTCIG
ncbi:hypothetical protein COMA2_40250 [Candidatus Nitrospira nitrificans]|uniref:Transposase n=1 Tax=Candidatus Nitrospira nitrificans TaxID=1742973 RepID=A0A0S4LKV3_9BACT|nr:hypothetical protein COMA2_40250 [Candidatus Nitrospira nitrificans]